MAADSRGFLWVGTHQRIVRVPRHSETGTMRRTRSFELGKDLPGKLCHTFLAADGTVWVGAIGGLTRFSLDATGNVSGIRSFTRFGPRTRSIRHYTTDDGLANPEVLVAHRDRHGDIWFGTEQGISRLVPSGDHFHAMQNMKVRPAGGHLELLKRLK